MVLVFFSMKSIFSISILITITACSALNDYQENDGQRYQFCTLESCKDEMEAIIRVIPRDKQIKYDIVEPDPDNSNLSKLHTYYDLDKSNWVARIRLVTVPMNEDFQVKNNNKTITSKQVQYCNSFDPPLYWNDVVLTAAKVTSDFVITADCQLYGRPPGSNLADKFCIPYFPKEKNRDEEYLVSYDEPAVIAKLFYENLAPMPLTDYFFAGVMVHRGFWLQPAEMHEENPETINFHIEYDAWTDTFEPYADNVRPGYVSKGSDRHLFADFEVDLSGRLKVEGWAKDDVYKYPW